MSLQSNSSMVAVAEVHLKDRQSTFLETVYPSSLSPPSSASSPLKKARCGEVGFENDRSIDLVLSTLLSMNNRMISMEEKLDNLSLRVEELYCRQDIMLQVMHKRALG